MNLIESTCTEKRVALINSRDELKRAKAYIIEKGNDLRRLARINRRTKCKIRVTFIGPLDHPERRIELTLPGRNLNAVLKRVVDRYNADFGKIPEFGWTCFVELVLPRSEVSIPYNVWNKPFTKIWKTQA